MPLDVISRGHDWGGEPPATDAEHDAHRDGRAVSSPADLGHAAWRLGISTAATHLSPRLPASEVWCPPRSRGLRPRQDDHDQPRYHQKRAYPGPHVCPFVEDKDARCQDAEVAEGIERIGDAQRHAG